MGSAIVILAAGMSRRMGQHNKLLQQIGDPPTPMVRVVAEQAIASSVGEVYVVLGHQAEQVRLALDGLALNYIYNDDYQQGQSASVRTTVAALGERYDSLIIALGDMPFVSADVYRGLVERFRATGERSVVVPSYNGKRGNPVLWPRQQFVHLAAVEGDKGGRQVLQRLQSELVTLCVNDRSIFEDIDDHEQLAAYQ
ncbi:MAG: nucleotidyltransferase family protein [Halopseudomonas sp.]